ncbi:MAG: hypothetical protein VKP57_09615 [Candidatus Sericytochromatia bacterium]|nr:hypothetical protein [Candidatus Sericytochromatia bacterium]
MTTEAAAQEERKYWRIWAILVSLPLLSLAAQQTGMGWLAILVSLVVMLTSTWFAVTTWMHVHLEPRFVPYLCILGLAGMFMFFFMVAPDVLNHEGNNWQNRSADAPAHIERPADPLAPPGAASDTHH